MKILLAGTLPMTAIRTYMNCIIIWLMLMIGIWVKEVKREKQIGMSIRFWLEC